LRGGFGLGGGYGVPECLGLTAGTALWTQAADPEKPHDVIETMNFGLTMSRIPGK
jgi:hypothetical protein